MLAFNYRPLLLFPIEASGVPWEAPKLPLDDERFLVLGGDPVPPTTSSAPHTAARDAPENQAWKSGILTIEVLVPLLTL